MEEPLVNIEEQGPEWLEWCAALYESYASDREWSQQVTYLPATGTYSLPAVGSALASLGDYCTAAQRVAEDLENKIYEDRQNKIEFEEYCQDQQAEYDLAWGCWQETIYDPDR